MQILEIGTYEVRKSDEGEVAIVVPNVNDMEYIQSIDLVSINVADGDLNINYSYEDNIDRKLKLKDVSISTQYMIKGASLVNVVELMHEETMVYQVTDISY
jgi:hypothetical protein